MDKLPLLTIRVSALFLCVALPCVGQSREDRPEVFSGTILGFHANSQRLILAIDSRKSNEDATRIDDSSCKVIALSDVSFFFYSGGLLDLVQQSSGRIIFSATETAKAAQANVSPRPNTREGLVSIATAWAEVMKKQTDSLLRYSKREKVEGLIGLGGFGGFAEGGEPLFVLANMGVNIPQDKDVPPTSFYHIEFFPSAQSQTTRHVLGGTNSIVSIAEFDRAQTPRAKQAMREFVDRLALDGKTPDEIEIKQLIAALEAAIAWNPSDKHIGGMVDGLLLPRNGTIHWIQRKQNCYEEDAKKLVHSN